MFVTALLEGTDVTWLWDELHEYFDTDDGSLPDLPLSGLSPEDVPRLYAFIRQHAQPVSADAAYYWDLENDCSCSLDAVPNAAELVVQGKAQAFIFLAVGLTFLDTVIPDLGVFVWPEDIVLDYRMGKEWGPAQVEALFEFFYQLYVLAPSWRAQEEPFVSEHFDGIWKRYLQSRQSSC